VPRRRPESRPRSVALWRWLGLAVVLAIAIAYVQPIRAYLGAKEDVAARQVQKAALLRRQGELRHRLAQTDTQAFLEREARRLGLVRPGEQLFIIEDVARRG
jgi:cell division protein FtsB